MRDEPGQEHLTTEETHEDALERYWQALQAGQTGEPRQWATAQGVPEWCVPSLELLARLDEARKAVEEDSHTDEQTGFDETTPYVGSRPAGAVLQPGSLLGEFRIERLIGKGGMGQVHQAYHTRLKQPVALKVLAPALLDQPEAVARFEREMEAVARLEHPNVVGVKHAGEAEGTHYLVMDLVAGQTLAERVRRNGPLPVAEAAG
jgi:hypothetical protein